MWKIPLNSPFFDEAEEQAVKDVLRSGMVSQGAKVEEFEECVRRYCGARFAVAVSSCTAGLYLALRNKVDLWDTRVAIPAFTFPAAHQCVEHFGGEMSIEDIDVDKDTYNMNMTDTERGLRKADAIVPIHQFGLSCELNTIRKLANERGAFVLEDAACALGSEYKGEKIGRRGTAVFSFHGRKIITTGEGGMVVTDDEELYEAILQGRQFGRTKDGHFKGTGINFKMSDISAAIGIAQMEKLPKIMRLRKEIASNYWHAMCKEQYENGPILPMATSKQGTAQPSSFESGCNYQSYVIRLPTEANRNRALAYLRQHGIEAQVGSYDNSGGQCGVSAELARTTLALPIWPGMTEEMVMRVVTELEEAMK